MTETLQIPASDIEPPELTPEQEALVEEFRVALDDAEKFLLDQKPAICRLTGLEVRAVIGKGWATYPETGLVTIRYSLSKKAIQPITVFLPSCMN